VNRVLPVVGAADAVDAADAGFGACALGVIGFPHPAMPTTMTTVANAPSAVRAPTLVVCIVFNCLRPLYDWFASLTYVNGAPIMIRLKL
jgi:hypothetical protein